ncbi:MAG: hypothetical protein RBS73_14300 [Prolixibacteraceae bacterium]|jgi:hypothetical protein|nr:hypothetical protein [Prolixibacteraceae bacterium]
MWYNETGTQLLTNKQVEELRTKLFEKYKEDSGLEEKLRFSSYAEAYRPMVNAINSFGKTQIKSGSRIEISETFLRKIIHYKDTVAGYQLRKLNLCYLYATGQSFHEYYRQQTVESKPSVTLFEKEYQIWNETGKQYYIPRSTFTQLAWHAFSSNLQPDEYVFVLQSAVYYGDETMIALVSRCKEYSGTFQMLFNSLAGRGIRVGWRAECLFSQLDKNSTENFFRSLPEQFQKEDAWNACITRILSNRTMDYLFELSNGVDLKLRAYANEVLVQINNAIRWQNTHLRLS